MLVNQEVKLAKQKNSLPGKLGFFLDWTYVHGTLDIILWKVSLLHNCSNCWLSCFVAVWSISTSQWFW